MIGAGSLQMKTLPTPLKDRASPSAYPAPSVAITEPALAIAVAPYPTLSCRVNRRI